ncbi:MAG TPA: hypothetical protein VFX51_11850 [Solirubrobacteraceae bacterium]|nr:hypothetical protein [Solirubrobacteraceae bacterium]
MIRVAALLLLALLAPAVPAHAQDAPPSEVRVMTFNIWLGGDVVDFGNVIAAIRDARADIVGLQEAEGNTRRIAEAVRLHRRHGRGLDQDRGPEAGRYVARLMKDDGYAELAKTSFTVAAP